MFRRFVGTDAESHHACTSLMLSVRVRTRVLPLGRAGLVRVTEEAARPTRRQTRRSQRGTGGGTA